MRSRHEKDGQTGRSDKEGLNEAIVLHSSWRALNALQDQLMLVQKKQGKYERVLSAAATPPSSMDGERPLTN